ncbi:MAG TPA: O-antigen ligase family protein [Gemmataceae bacterium]|jgi:probable O-glycosylation ligase (exosortase A-associated)|nr:O-antigen ligase family protein [Gemmataceae bacterium]
MGRILTYLLTIGGSFLAIFYPFVGLLVYVCFAILAPESLWPWEFPGAGGGFSQIVAIALLIGWTFQSFGTWQFGKAAPTVACIVFFFLWAAAAWPMSTNMEVARAYVISLFKIVLPFLVGVTLVKDVKQLKQLAWVMVCTQGYVAFELNLTYLQRGINRVWNEGFNGMDNNSVAIGMVTGVGLAFFLGLGAKNIFAKMIAFGSAMMMAHIVLLSFSRGGMLALIITGAVGFFITPRKPIHYALLAASVLVILALSGEEVRQRFVSVFAEKEERDKSAESRLDLWRANFDVMTRHPLFGVGPHQWPEVAEDYGFEKGKEGHSLWLQTGAELGIPGFVSLLAFYLIVIIRLWPYHSENSLVPDPFYRDIARMVIAALVGFAVSAQFVSITFLEIPYYVVLLGAGALKLLSVPRSSLPMDEAAVEREIQAWQSYSTAAPF